MQVRIMGYLAMNTVLIIQRMAVERWAYREVDGSPLALNLEPKGTASCHSGALLPENSF